jgi:hypothetical protein
MASSWQELLGADLASTSVTTDPDGKGRIVVYANWPSGSQERLTETFQRCIDELWACLDSLVVESVELFSIRRRQRDSNRPRFFPMADSSENFNALLMESCLDGILRLQFHMIRDCQPFQQAPEDEHIEAIRSGLRQLLDWTMSLANGSRIDAWATPIDPKLHTGCAISTSVLHKEVAGPIYDGYVVAKYGLQDYVPGADIHGQAGTFIDLSFPDGFTPTSVDDTFERRLSEVIDTIARFIVSFAWLADQVPGARRVNLPAASGQTASWIQANRSKWQWTKEEMAALEASDLGLGVVAEADQVTLVVSTQHGVYERIIPDASPLRRHVELGTAAELAVHDAAATWGLPDFVIAPHVERKGAALREISDGLIVVGNRGAIVQVKSRSAEPRTAAREALWVTKQIAAASKQVDGTARRLSMEAIDMINGRGRKVAIDGQSIDWIGVIIIEHPDPPADCRSPEIAGSTRSVALLRRDWEFLFNQLRSSRAVIDYLHRVGSSTEVLGSEPQRYYELAAADAAASPGSPDSALKGFGEIRSLPLLPTAPAGSDDDEAHGMVRIMCEDIEDIANTHTESISEEERLQVLGYIDELPVGHRTELGRLLLDALNTARRVDSEEISWRFRTFRAGYSRAQLGFGVCSSFTEGTQAAFRAWLLLRHHERSKAESISEATSIGVLLTPRDDGFREWDTSLAVVNGDPELTEAELREFRTLWGARH